MTDDIPDHSDHPSQKSWPRAFWLAWAALVALAVVIIWIWVLVFRKLTALAALPP
jgi:uncharacterized membrane protein YcjF (UPF0283 family)